MTISGLLLGGFLQDCKTVYTDLAVSLRQTGTALTPRKCRTAHDFAIVL